MSLIESPIDPRPVWAINMQRQLYGGGRIHSFLTSHLVPLSFYPRCGYFCGQSIRSAALCLGFGFYAADQWSAEESEAGLQCSDGAIGGEE